jgi:hypothetical protein
MTSNKHRHLSPRPTSSPPSASCRRRSAVPDPSTEPRPCSPPARAHHRILLHLAPSFGSDMGHRRSGRRLADAPIVWNLWKIWVAKYFVVIGFVVSLRGDDTDATGHGRGLRQPPHQPPPRFRLGANAIHVYSLSNSCRLSIDLAEDFR